MAGENAPDDDTAVAQEEELDEDFEAGFAAKDTPAPAPTGEQPVEEVKDGKDDKPAKDDKPPKAPKAAATPAAPAAAAPAAAPAAAAAPKKVEIEETELQSLRERASNQTAAYQQAFDKAFGQIGAMRQAIDKLQTKTPTGEKVEIDEADFKELAETYPELAKFTLQGLNKALAKMRGTGGTDPEAIEKIVTERVAERLKEATAQQDAKVTDAVLNSIVPKWRTQVNTPAFGEWLKGQSSEVQALAMSDDLGDAADMLHRWRADMNKPAATPATPAAPAQGKPTGRHRQLAAGVAVKGDAAPAGGAPATEDDDFTAGFKEGKA